MTANLTCIICDKEPTEISKIIDWLDRNIKIYKCRFYKEEYHQPENYGTYRIVIRKDRVAKSDSLISVSITFNSNEDATAFTLVWL